MKKLFTLIFISFIFTACSQNTVKEDADHTEHTTAQTESVKKTPVENKVAEKDPHTDEAPKTEKKIIIPKEVSAKYKSLIVEVGHKKSNKAVETDILIGQKAEIAGTPLTVELEAYLPDFTMNDMSNMTSKTAEENNPAAKIKIYKSDKLIFDGWLFKKFPDVHPFDDPDYTLSLKNAVQK